MDRYALFKFLARVCVTAMPQSTKPHGQPVAPTANDAAGRRPSPPASQDRGCNSRFEQRRRRARRRPSRNLSFSLWRGSSRLSQWRSKANRRTCHNLCLSQWRGSSSQWRRSPPSASCEAVRASSVSEASRASASGEAGRAADLIQRPAAKDRKGRVRVQVQGFRTWVRKEDAGVCVDSLQQVYRRLQVHRRRWGNCRCIGAWQKAAAAEIATNWAGCKCGLRCFMNRRK